jgi:hypothetical protein
MGPRELVLFAKRPINLGKDIQGPIERSHQPNLLDSLLDQRDNRRAKDFGLNIATQRNCNQCPQYISVHKLQIGRLHRVTLTSFLKIFTARDNQFSRSIGFRIKHRDRNRHLRVLL